MAEGIDSYSSCEVEVTALLIIPEVLALAADEDGGRAHVSFHHKWCLLGDQLG